MGRVRGVGSRATGAVGGVYGRSRRRVRRFFIDTENTKLVLGLVTIGVALSLAIPTFFPELKRSGPDCLSLMSPPGGNQRSMLAENDNHQDLALEVDIDASLSNNDGDPMIALNDSLVVDVVFKNEDIGAVTLYLRDGFEAIGPATSLENTNITGLYLEIIPLGSTQALTDPESLQGLPLIDSFNKERELHILQSRRRCVMRIIFSPQRLARMGIIGPGQYGIKAYYRNQNVGFVSQKELSEASATPMFLTNGIPDQGVWTGRVQSKEVRFEIGSP